MGFKIKCEILTTFSMVSSTNLEYEILQLGRKGWDTSFGQFSATRFTLNITG